jgi:hypothetical protein
LWFQEELNCPAWKFDFLRLHHQIWSGQKKGATDMTMTSDDVISILGPVDETLVAEVIATGATQTELAEALAWANNDEALIGEGRPLPTGRTAALVDLLVTEEEELE